jgi:hypothetical protein
MEIKIMKSTLHRNHVTVIKARQSQVVLVINLCQLTC